MEKKIAVNVTVDQKVLRQIDELARADQRSRSFIINLLLLEALVARAAQQLIIDEKQQQKWPVGCRYPSTCAEHGKCMYAHCVHKKRDIRAEIREAHNDD